jgi:hypothetical protein
MFGNESSLSFSRNDLSLRLTLTPPHPRVSSIFVTLLPMPQLIPSRNLFRGFSLLLVFSICSCRSANHVALIPQPDRILILKSARSLSLMKSDQILKSYKIALWPTTLRRQRPPGRSQNSRRRLFRRPQTSQQSFPSRPASLLSECFRCRACASYRGVTGRRRRNSWAPNGIRLARWSSSPHRLDRRLHRRHELRN